MNVVLIAAHAGYSSDHPLGGAAAVAHGLAKEWSQDSSLKLTVVGSGPGWPDISCRYFSLASPSVSPDQLSVFSYARFSRQFERQTTDFLRQHPAEYPPEETAIITHDISEGPDFKTLAQDGYRLVGLVHVDVVEYFWRMYLKETASPEFFARAFEFLESKKLSWLLPDVLRLVFEKQRDFARYCSAIVVPSSKMAQVLTSCYGRFVIPKIHVIPWGAVGEAVSEPEIQKEKQKITAKLALRDGALVLMTLSRLSPEKGLDILLKSLILWEKEGKIPELEILIGGAPAYMQGQAYAKKLRNLAGQLQQTRVHFLGYLSESQKQACFQLADLFVCPSWHESYGLTMVEAMRAGLPVLSSDHHSARDLIPESCGGVVSYPSFKQAPQALLAGLKKMTSLPKTKLQTMGQYSQRISAPWTFSHATAQIKDLIALLFPKPSGKSSE